ncbi:hypothetical protein GIB67_040731 [Kingdonia uniflora]|uniref:Protein CMSS1 n=1 Tax=Kingdonia uniflora TaxID=39325 RepID=A0A7J7KUG6_9MAGN|nr:hypothetical protein GIB67_040731 [Kingdonia uniflora]
MAKPKPNFSKQNHNSKKKFKKKMKKTSSTPKQNPNRIPLGINKHQKVKKKVDDEKPTTTTTATTTKTKKVEKEEVSFIVSSGPLSASQQLSFFLNQFQSGTGLKLSSLELESYKDSCILKLSDSLGQDAGDLSEHIKSAFGSSWKEELCEPKFVDGKIDPGSPAVLVISTSALRSLELFRSLRPLTAECRAAKLFAKHMKIEEQVSALKSRVNIASGTPSRINKLIDMDALRISRLKLLVFDMHTDAKGYSLLSLPQVSDEFWELYKTQFHHRLVQGNMRICLYGPITERKKRKNAVTEDDN